MKHFFLLTLFALGTFAAQAQTVQRQWQSDLGQLELTDDPATLGEEALIWTSEGQRRIVRIDEVSGDNFTGSFVLSRAGGEKILDVTLNLILDESCRQTLPLLKDPTFRKAFKKAPESCPEGTNGLVILSDNRTLKQSLHCLVPQ